MTRNLRHQIPAQVKLIASLTAFLLIVYFCLRALFYFSNDNVYQTLSLAQLLFAFTHGVRFDLYSVLWVNLPLFIFILFTPMRWQGTRWFFKATLSWLFLVNGIFIGFNVADSELINFSGKRITMDIFFLAEDIGGMGKDIVTFYWFQTVVGLCILGLLFTGVRRILLFHREQTLCPSPRLLASCMAIFFCLIFLFLGLRGGWQLKPIRPVNAFSGLPQTAGNLVLNTTFTMLRSKRSGSIQPFHFFANEAAVEQVLRFDKSSKSDYWGSLKGKNIVLIIMESFSMEYTGLSPHLGPSYTPFLDKLSKHPEARVFHRHFANGRRSIDAVPSLLAGIPTLMAEPFISSNYQTNKIGGWGQALRDVGYQTLFFHGAQNGSMFFDSFSAQAGFEKYYGLNQYPNASKDGDGSWGIYDEPFFLFSVDTLSQTQQPFAVTLFSLSSHHPYKIPEAYVGRFPEGELDIHKSIGYADFALSRFFQSAETKSWYKDTVFFITADHTSKTLLPSSQTIYGAHWVPLVIFAPGETKLPKHPGNVFTQHVDIPKTIYGLLGIEPSMATLFGADIFSLNEKAGSTGEVYNFLYPGYWYMNNNGLIRLDDQGEFVAAELTKDFHHKVQNTENTKERSVLRARAWLQYYVHGLLQNQWYQKSEKQALTEF